MEQYQSGEKEKPSLLQRLGFRNSNKHDSHLENGRKKQRKKEKTRKTQKIEEIFTRINNELKQYVVGQDPYLEQLVVAFKRPYLLDNGKSYKNIIIIIGPQGSGRNYSIRVLAKLLSIEKLIKDSSLYVLDFSAYADASSVEKLFYPDMYRAFYSDASIVVFDNFDRACDDVLSSLCILGIAGSLKTNKRFGWTRGEFQENTGSYAQGLSDYISANGKFIVLISDKKRNYIDKLFNTEFFTHVYDVIETSKLENDALVEITSSLLESSFSKAESATGVSIIRDNFAVELVNACNKKDGIHSIEKVIEHEIYKPLIEKCLRKEILPESEICLTINSQDEFIYANEHMLGHIDKNGNAVQLAAVKKQLDEIVGLDSVKEFVLKLEENLRFQRKYNQGNEQNMSLHMVFKGNPGTGKTTIARIIAQYLKALGILSIGHLIEVSRTDLVGQYVGETAQKTSKKVNEALNGVLFIDEAYSLILGKNDLFGLEAIDTIVKYMEDYREELVIIAAGYSKEMEEFLDSNSGLRSRFNYVIEFPDYTPKELLEITTMMAHKASYMIDEECNEELIDYYNKKQISGKNDSGNARMARNIIETAIAMHSHRFAEVESLDESKIRLLSLEDFGFQKNNFDLEQELENIVGLNKVKNLIRVLNAQLVVEKKRREAGFEVNTNQSLNMLFLGNPGTGKTYVARIMAKLLKEVGYLKSDEFVEVDRSGLVAEYAGQTAQKTKDVFLSALGGVLFIDEAYSLSANNAFDKEAVDTLVKLVEDHAGNIVVILAGYKKEMSEFLNANSGLHSRFNITMEFEDYSEEELFSIMVKMTKDRGFIIDSDANSAIIELLHSKNRVGEQSGNARMVRNILEAALRNQTKRLSLIQSYESPEELITLKDIDFIPETVAKEFDLEAKLNDIIGLENIKEYLRSLYSMLRVELARKQLGIDTQYGQTLHMIFTGNPGTGKTTMARIVGEVLFEMGILSTKNFVETDRAGLVAGYVGQTSLKTKAVINQALDGVLFIDEAYSLASGGNSSDFGREAIDVLVKDMDDNRDRLVVILAGYTDKMQHFLTMNPGLKSRFPNILEFPNYSPYELIKISEGMLAKKKYKLDEDAKQKLEKIFVMESAKDNFGNGRFARNMCERIIRNLSARINRTNDFSMDALTTITGEDVF